MSLGYHLNKQITLKKALITLRKFKWSDLKMLSFINLSLSYRPDIPLKSSICMTHHANPVYDVTSSPHWHGTVWFGTDKILDPVGSVLLRNAWTGEHHTGTRNRFCCGRGMTRSQFHFGYAPFIS